VKNVKKELNKKKRENQNAQNVIKVLNKMEMDKHHAKNVLSVLICHPKDLIKKVIV